MLAEISHHLRHTDFLLLLTDVDVFHGLAVQIVDLQLISRYKSFEIDGSHGMALLVESTGKAVLVAKVGKILPSAAGAKPVSSASCSVGSGGRIVSVASWYQY